MEKPKLHKKKQKQCFSETFKLFHLNHSIMFFVAVFGFCFKRKKQIIHNKKHKYMLFQFVFTLLPLINMAHERNKN